jgi:flagellar biogenesis protein FliO
MTGLYLQVISALAIVVGLIFVAAFFLKKRQGKPGLMKLVAYQSFGPRRGVAAMKVGREILLIGVTASDLKVLRIFNEGDFESGLFNEMNTKMKKLKDMKEQLNELQ